MIKMFVEYNRQNRSGEYKIEASMAKLVRRHTSNVEIIGSNPIGSIYLIFPAINFFFFFFFTLLSHRE